MRQSTHRAAPRQTVTVPSHHRTESSPPPSTACPQSSVSQQFDLPRLLESRQAVEVIPGVLYFASIAERPPPARAFVPPVLSRRASLDSGDVTGVARHGQQTTRAAAAPAPSSDPHATSTSAASSAETTHTKNSRPSRRSVSLPLVLQPLQMPGPGSAAGCPDAATEGAAAHSTRYDGSGSSHTGTMAGGAGVLPDRRESLLSLTDMDNGLCAAPDAVAGTTVGSSAPTKSAAAAAAAAAPAFSLKDYLKSHYPGVSYPVRSAAATGPSHPLASTSTMAGLSAGSSCGGGGGLLKSTLAARSQAGPASAVTHRGMVSSLGGSAASRRRADRSVSITVAPSAAVSVTMASPDEKGCSTISTGTVSAGAGGGGGPVFTTAAVDVAGEEEDLASHSASLTQFPPVASHLHEALLQPGDGGNGGACLLSPHDGAFYVSVFGDPAFEYRSFFADFGPLDLGCVVRFSRRLALLLEMSAGYEWHDTDKTVSEMTMGSAAAAAAAAARKRRSLSVLEPPNDLSARLPDVVPIVVCTGLETHERANVACLLGCFCVGALRWSASAVQQRLQQQVYPPLLAFRDASSGASSYPLSVTDVVRGMRKASQLAWVDIRAFDVDAYDRAKANDCTWIVPNKILAMSSPEDDKPNRTGDVYARLLGGVGVTMVVRLNDALYDARSFWRAGIRHVELEFPDGTAPNDADLKRFLSVVEDEFGESALSNGTGTEVGGTYRGLPPATTRVPVPPGKRAATASAAIGRTGAKSKAKQGKAASPTTSSSLAVGAAVGTGPSSQKKGIVAVHCRAGLGRTGTVIAVYMMRHYGFTARESISWIRLCRPGSITGIQQQYLESVERRLTPPARVWTDLQWAASAAGSVGFGGGRMDATQPAYQSHGAVAMDPSRHGGGGAGGGGGRTPSAAGGGTTAARRSGDGAAGADVLSGSMNSDAPPQFAASFQNSGGRRGTMNIFYSGLSRAATTAAGEFAAGGDGAERSLSGLFPRRTTPVNYGPESFGQSPGSGSLVGLASSTVGGVGGMATNSRPGTAPSGGAGNAVGDSVAAEQRYELAEVEALLCDPTFVPHRSILERLKYPSSYFLALEQANPFGTAVALQREFASRRRQQTPATRAAVEKVSHTPSKTGSAGASLIPSATPATGANNNNNNSNSNASVTNNSSAGTGGSASRRPMSATTAVSSAVAVELANPHARVNSGTGTGGGGAAVVTQGALFDGTRSATAGARHDAVPTPRPPLASPSLKLDSSAVVQAAAVARSNAALTSRGGIASRYQAIRNREVHAMQDSSAITIPSRIRLNSVQLDAANGGGAGGLGGQGSSYTLSGSTYGNVGTGASVSGGGGSGAGGGGPSGLSFREGIHATRRASVSVGDTSFGAPVQGAPLQANSSAAGVGSGMALGDGLLECSVVLPCASPLQAVNSSARSLQNTQQTATASAVGGAAAAGGGGASLAPSHYMSTLSSAGTPTAAATTLSRQGSSLGVHRPPPPQPPVTSPQQLSAPFHLATTNNSNSNSNNNNNSGAAPVPGSNARAVYTHQRHGVAVTALQPTLIAAAGGGTSTSNLLFPSMNASAVASSVTVSAQRRAAKLGWGTREVRLVR